MLITFFMLLISYLIGSIPSGLIIGKVFYNKDIRQFGSGNLGATNAFRVLGKKAGFTITTLDILKGIIPVLLASFSSFNITIDPLYFGILAALGHIYPIFAGFRGGKAVATSCGVVIAYTPIVILFLAAIFFLVVKTTKYVSLASIISAISGLIYAIIAVVFFHQNAHILLLFFLLATFIIYRHRENIKRIKNKTEAKVKW